MTNLAEILKQKGISPSYQRLVIYDYLYGNTMHPKVNDIYNDLKPKVPSLSKTTIYNTVSLFLTKGLVQEVLIDGNEVRIDADIKTHGHFKCKTCNKVYDIEIEDNLNFKGLENFNIEQTHIYFTGTCRNCNK